MTTDDFTSHGIHRRGGYPRTCSLCLREVYEDEDIVIVKVDYVADEGYRVIGFTTNIGKLDLASIEKENESGT